MDFYHVLNRGLNKSTVFRDDGDCVRFVRGLYVFNDLKTTPNSVSQRIQWLDGARERDPLVFIHAWCLMKNHYHILLSPVDDDMTNLSLFMKKLNGGYAKFFNEKYERSGYVWQGKYKKIQIEHDNQFLYIPYYIHLNPLDFKFKRWRKGSLVDLQEAISYLDEYKWSSWNDYTDKKNVPSILHKAILGETLGSRQNQIDQIKK